jgi:hypothetical protein
VPFLVCRRSPDVTAPLTDDSGGDADASPANGAKSAHTRGSSEGVRSCVMITAMAAILFCVTGAEHAVATWLPTYGQRVGHIGACRRATCRDATSLPPRDVPRCNQPAATEPTCLRAQPCAAADRLSAQSASACCARLNDAR